MTKQVILTGNSVTPESVERSIKKEKYIKMGEKVTVCHLTLVDGYEVIGKAGVVDPANYNPEIGEDIARKDAMKKVWSHLGSILQDRLAGGIVG